MDAMNNPQADGLVPRSVQEILALTLRIYRDNAAEFLLMSAAVLIPLAIFQLISFEIFSSTIPLPTVNEETGQLENIDFGAIFGAGFFILIFSLIVQQIILNGLFTYTTSEALLGRKTTLIDALAQTAERYVPLGLGLLVVYAILIGSMIAMVFLLFLCGLGFGLFIFLAVTLFALVVPTIILEKGGPINGLIRAFALAKARFWPVFWLLAAVLLISQLLAILFSLTSVVSIDSPIADTIINTSYNIVVAPIMPIALTLMYYDTRIRMEGLDMGLDNVDSPTPRPSDVPSTRMTIALDRSDLSNIVILAVGFIGLTLILSVLLGGFMTTTITP